MRASLCSWGRGGGRRPAWGVGAALIAVPLLLGAACRLGQPEPRPSFLLVVIDTLRADAVSAYADVEGTTPNLDALAAGGVRYARAFAPSGWTLPSHATLFTGLGVERHGVGIHGDFMMPEELITLAERLRDAGYHTAGFSENRLVTQTFGMNQGFEHFSSEVVGINQVVLDPPYDVVREVSDWAARRSGDRPFFVFVNLFDAHDPYLVRESNPFLPEGVSVERARAVQSGKQSLGIADRAGMCDRLPPPRDLEILRGLYLGEVAAADAKLGRIHALVEEAAHPRDLVTVVTSDHGEHLGEHGLLGHEFSLRNVLLSVPLVVHGVPEVAPGLVEGSVWLGDIVPSVLRWAGIDVPEDLDGRPLSLVGGPPVPERDLVAAYTDSIFRRPPGRSPPPDHRPDPRRRRRDCREEHRVFGDILSLTRFPFKLIWYERHPPQLYDLSWDPRELSDIAPHRPELVARLSSELERLRKESRLRPPSEPSEIAPEAVEALRALGYAP